VITGRDGLVTRTPFVFVGNNTYQLSGLEAATRNGLHGGVLQVCTVRNPNRLALLRALALALAGNTNATPDLFIASAEEARVVTLRRRVRVAVDGEVIIMNSPLVYSICPAALRVLARKES
jgi:diacylglycerol kinase family enzyme